MFIFWFDVFWVGGNWVGVIRAGVIWVNVIRIFAPIFFNLKIILAPRVFENYVAYRVFNYWCIMQQRHAPVGKIRRPSEKEFEALLTGNIWVVVSNGSQWVHTDTVIITSTESSSLHFSTTLQTDEVYVPITVSPSINGSNLLVRVDDEWVTCNIFQKISRTPKGLRFSCHE